MKSRICIIDDEPLMLESLRRTLRGQAADWESRCFDCSSMAWRYLQRESVDVVVTDLSMPVMSGLELVRQLRERDATRDVPIIVLTGSNDIALKGEALDCGATDLLNKPVHPVDLIARIRNALRLKSYQDELKLRNEELDRRVQDRTSQLQASRREIIQRLSRAAEFRDEDTGNHVLRVAEYSREIASALGETGEFIETLGLAAPLHDIGKIGISDLILLKPGPLSEQERLIMQTHCEIGEQILQAEFPPAWNGKPERDGSNSPALFEADPLLQMALEIAGSHHERWDGQGYPRGLSGESIPLSGRIVAVADVYDALTSERPYKPAYPPDKAVRIMQQQRGRHFDPRVFDAFLMSWPQIEVIRESFAEVRADHSGGDAASQFAQAGGVSLAANVG